MFSKVLIILSGFSFGVISTGCGIHLREPAPKGAPIDIKAKDSDCFEGSGRILREYFEGNSSPEKVKGFWGCVSRSLRHFVERARGAQAGTYSADELRKFLEKYFLKDFLITDGLLSESMELKASLIGGQKSHLTIGDFSRIQDFTRVLEVQSLRMLPYLPLTPERVKAMAVEPGDGGRIWLKAAVDSFVASFAEIGGFIEENGNSYPFSRLEALLGEVQKVSQSQKTDMIGRFKDQLPEVKMIKSVFLSPGEQKIGGSEWKTVLANGASAYGLFLKAVYLYHRNEKYPESSYIYGLGRETSTQYLHECTEFLKASVSRHAFGFLPFSEIDRMIDLFFPENLGVRKRVVKNFSRPFLRRFLSGTDFGPGGRGAQGLTVRHLQTVQEAVSHWSEGQRFIESLFGETPSHGGFKGVSLFEGQLLNAVSPLRFPFLQLEVSNQVMDHLIRDKRPMYRGEETEIFLGPFYNGDIPHSFHDLSEMNWIHEVVRLLIKAYSDDEARALSENEKGGVTFQEFERGYQDIKELGVELKIFDENDPFTARKRFREADLFTFASDGNNLIKLEEGAQELAFLLSGKHLSLRFYDELKDRCPNGPSDQYGRVTLEPKCFRREFFSRVASFWGHMPGLLEYYRGLDEQTQEEFEHVYEDASRKKGYSQDWMNSDDYETFATMAHYLEAIFSRYDRDKSGTLNEGEIEEAYEVVKSELKKAVETTSGTVLSENQLRILFRYLLATGVVLEGSKKDKLKIAWFMVKEKLQNFLAKSHIVQSSEIHADRFRILQIFSALSKATR